jgi:hypothetical protein
MEMRFGVGLVYFALRTEDLGQPFAGRFLASARSMACSNVPSKGANVSGFGPVLTLAFFSAMNVIVHY